MFCSKCGTKNQDEAAFCRACGAPIRGPRPDSKPSIPHAVIRPEEAAPAAHEDTPLKQQPDKEPVPMAKAAPDSIQSANLNGKQTQQAAEQAAFPMDQSAKPSESTQPVSDGNKQPLDSAQQARHYRRIGILAVSAAALVILAGLTALCIFLFGGTSYQRAIDNMMKATLGADAKAAYAMFPKAYQQALLDEQDYRSDREAIAALDDALKQTKEELDDTLGEGWQYSYKILSTENLSSRRLRELKEEYDEFDIQIDGAMEAEVELAIRCDQGNQSSTLEIPLIKIGRSWYIDFANIPNMLRDIL